MNHVFKAVPDSEFNPALVLSWFKSVMLEPVRPVNPADCSHLQPGTTPGISTFLILLSPVCCDRLKTSGRQGIFHVHNYTNKTTDQNILKMTDFCHNSGEKTTTLHWMTEIIWAHNSIKDSDFTPTVDMSLTLDMLEKAWKWSNYVSL